MVLCWDGLGFQIQTAILRKLYIKITFLFQAGIRREV